MLDSGTGRLVTIDPKNGSVNTVAVLPGYARGLAFCGQFAFVGLSKIRETSTFGGMPIAEKLGELKFGVWVVDVTTGQMVATLEFDRAVEEIFSVTIIPGVRFPSVVGFEKDMIHGAFVVPPGT